MGIPEDDFGRLIRRHLHHYLERGLVKDFVQRALALYRKFGKDWSNPLVEVFLAPSETTKILQVFERLEGAETPSEDLFSEIKNDILGFSVASS